METFEGFSGQSNTITFDLIFKDGTTVVLTSHHVNKAYYDSAFNPRGTYFDGSTEESADYAVVSDFSPLPASATTEVSGPWYVLKHYKSSAKGTVTGTTTVTYAFSTTDAVEFPRLTTTTIVKDGNGVTKESVVSVYSISKAASNGSIAPAKLLTETTTVPNGQVLYYSYA
ncbi:hypothetical protein ACS5PN_26950 [Roseateles sp. NT4]|uniref:hypothetical protein n=1 Tax=Roseateles sp. NT4 TaxID=3453715 RepID=UPI003EED3D33